MILIGQEKYCDFPTIKEGIECLERKSETEQKKMVILSGIYHEILEIRLSNFEMVGLGDVQIIGSKGARHMHEDGQEIGTFRSATVFIEGENIHLKNIAIINDAGQGEDIGQAVALFAYCHLAEFEQCRLIGHQDTLCTGPLPGKQGDGTPFTTIPLKHHYQYCKQVYKDCYVNGTVDFIFGGADAHFIDCQIESRKRPDGGKGGYITAASTPQGQEQGYIFERCLLTAEQGVENIHLGRPWRPYAQTAFKHCYIGDHIIPEGWDNWGKESNEQTAQYEEIGCMYTNQIARPSWIRVE